MIKVLWFSFLLLFVGCLGPGMFAQELVYTQDIDGKEFKSQSFPFFQEAHELPQGLSICLA